jgi:hypothetical protein
MDGLITGRITVEQTIEQAQEWLNERKQSNGRAKTMNEKLESIKTAELEKAAQFPHTIKVCVAAGCRSAQSELLKEALENEVTTTAKRKAVASKASAASASARLRRWWL